MAKYKKNEETVDNTVSPSQSLDNTNTEKPKERAVKASKKPQFQVSCAHGLNFAVGGKYYNTGKSDFVTPNGRVFKGIANDQDAMQEVYEFGPIALNWIKSPAGYTAKWEKFI